MVRHDPHGHNGEPDPPGTPGVRALGAMAAAARRAREVQEGGPPTRAVEIRFDDEPARCARPADSQSPAQPVAPPGRRPAQPTRDRRLGRRRPAPGGGRRPGRHARNERGWR